MSEKLRLGVIGTGLAWHRLHWPALQKLSDKYEIVALCNKNIKKAYEFADSIGLDHKNCYDYIVPMLDRDDIDVVDVAVPIYENFEMNEAVILSSKKLISEKPFASNPKEASMLIQLKNKERVRVMVAENYRYDQGSRIIKEALSNGSLGDVTHFIYNSASDFEADMIGDTFEEKEWRQHPSYTGGSLLDAGIHDIARIRYLFGEIDSVYATAVRQDKDYCPYKTVNANLKFRSGVTGQYCYYSENKDLNTNAPLGLRIYGTNGELYYESKDKGLIKIYYVDGHVEDKGFEPNMGYFHEFENFYHALKQNKEVESTPEKEIGDIQAIFDIVQSIETNEIVKGTSKIWLKSPERITLMV